MTNQYLSDFHATVSTRYPVDGASMSYSEWVERNTSDPKRPGRSFSFDGYEFQRAIADDMSRALAVIKPSQVGMTEVQIRKALAFAARNRGVSVIFSLPNQTMFKRVSKTRLKPLVQRERAFQSTMSGDKPLQSMDLLEINGSFVYLTGMTEGDATSIPADMLAHDEVDLSDQTMIGLYQSRLQNSSWKITHKFSTPTHPNYGIDAVYQSSDQKEYMCRCDACGHHQIPRFNTKFIAIPGYKGGEDLSKLTEEVLQGIDLSDVYVKCERCSRPLDTLNPANREWVARHPGRRISGYRVPPFATHSLNPTYVIEQLLEMTRLEQLKGWYNTVLGETFSDGSNQLTEVQVKACLRDGNVQELPTHTPMAVGIDVGLICHVVWGPMRGGQPHATNFALVPSEQLVEFVKGLDETINIVCGAIDRLPYTPTANAVRDATNGRILPVQYSGSRLVVLQKDALDEITHAHVNRTSVIDLIVGRIRRANIELCGYTDKADMLVTHLCDMVRIEAPEVEAKWEKVTGNDHWMHALGYLNIAPKVKEVSDLSGGGETRTQIFIGGIGSVRDTKPEPVLIGRGRSTYLGAF